MELSAKIKESLRRAEADLRYVGAETFRAGDDAASGQARNLVSGVMALRAQLGGGDAKCAMRESKTPAAPRRPSKAAKKSSRGSGKSKYPRYEVRNGALVRVGWSKKQKSEYVHKASRETFDRTLSSMSTLAQTSHGPFMAETIIERTADDTGPVPAYQAYVVIGLLREQGSLEQSGREGYLIPDDITSRALTVWDQLAGTNNEDK